MIETTLDVSFRLRLLTVNLVAPATLWRGVWWAQPALAGTPWSAAADALDIAGALAVFVRGEGFVVVRSRAAHESDYEAALRVATFLMGGSWSKPPTVDPSSASGS